MKKKRNPAVLPGIGFAHAIHNRKSDKLNCHESSPSVGWIEVYACMRCMP